METEQILKVSADDFFDLLFNSICHDISAALGEEVDKSLVSTGYTYSKKLTTRLGTKGKSSVTIDELTRPTAYKASFNTPQGLNTIAYEIEETDPGQIKVKVTESFTAASKWTELNFKIISPLFRKSSKKRVARTLQAMEAYIIEQNKILKEQPE